MIGMVVKNGREAAWMLERVSFNCAQHMVLASTPYGSVLGLHKAH